MHADTGRACGSVSKDDDLPLELRWPENWPKTCKDCIDNNRKNRGDELAWVNGGKR